MPNSQLNNIKSGIKDRTKVTLNLSSNVIGDYNNGANFPHKLLLIDTHTQVSRLCKVFVNSSSANIMFIVNKQ